MHNRTQIQGIVKGVPTKPLKHVFVPRLFSGEYALFGVLAGVKCATRFRPIDWFVLLKKTTCPLPITMFHVCVRECVQIDIL